MKCPSPLDQRVLDTLNRVLEIDPPAVTELLSFRVPCNDRLADDKEVQVLDDEMGPLVGVLGLLNGILGPDENGQGRLQAVPGPGGLLVRFELRG